MTLIKTAAAALVAFGAIAFVLPVAVQAADASSAVKMADTDHDGSIDLTEAKDAAMKHFEMADTDHDKTIDSKEAGMTVSGADTDKDGTLDKAEYESAVTSAFKSADTDHDGTVDAKELDTPAGEKLSAMMGGKS